MRDRQRGTTLTELLAVMALLAVVAAVLVALLPITVQSWGRIDRHAEMLQNARRAADKIVRELRAARSIQTATSALVRFAVARGDGTRETPIVEYRLNAATAELEYRVAADFAYRRRITVTAGAVMVPVAYSVSVAFDHAALVAAGKSLASGDDVRVFYWSGTQWVELDRFKDVPVAWNTSGTRVWFRTQAAIPAGGSDNNYYLHYGDLASAPAPADGDYVFLDYEDGVTLGDWVRRDACSGTYSASLDGFLFQSSSGSCYRRFTRNVPHGDVEVFWGFRSDSPNASTNRHQVGAGARLSAAGAGYLVTPADATNRRLSIRYVTSWVANGSIIAQTPVGYSVTPGVDYYARFYLVGSSLRTKYWRVGTTEPGWLLQTTHPTISAGIHYGQIDGLASPETHRHRTLILRQRIDPEPTAAVGLEESGARADAFEPLAGPFRSMSVRCFNVAGASTSCATVAAVRSVEVTLVTMDPTGEVTDIAVTSRAYRQSP